MGTITHSSPDPSSVTLLSIAIFLFVGTLLAWCVFKAAQKHPSYRLRGLVVFVCTYLLWMVFGFFLFSRGIKAAFLVSVSALYLPSLSLLLIPSKAHKEHKNGSPTSTEYWSALKDARPVVDSFGENTIVQKQSYLLVDTWRMAVNIARASVWQIWNAKPKPAPKPRP